MKVVSWKLYWRVKFSNDEAVALLAVESKVNIRMVLIGLHAMQPSWF